MMVVEFGKEIGAVFHFFVSHTQWDQILASNFASQEMHKKMLVLTLKID